jgi:hypothetical protein
VRSKVTPSRHFMSARQPRWPVVILVVLAVSVLTSLAAAQKPIAALPQVYIDTTWNPPVGGTTWAAHTAAQFTSALTASVPGDVIVLDAGVTYTGSFRIPAKVNPNQNWIYVVSSNLVNLPASTRVSPANVADMPKLVSTNAAPIIDVLAGANYWRFVGLNITETYVSSNLLFGNYTSSTPLPDNIFIDRCYIHGLPTASVHRAILANDTNFAIVDSYVSDIQGPGVETQGIALWTTPGPIKIVNNYISATTENVMFGGAGGPANPYVPSDIEMRNNYLFKPLSWVGTSSIKDAFEIKSGQRVLFDSNTIENVWANAQNGFAFQLTVRTSQSGDIAVVSDITITNNVLKNVVAGFNTLAKDDTCGAAQGYPNCHNPGSEARIYIANNLMTFYDPTLPGGLRNEAWQLADGTDRITTPGVPIQGVPSDIVFQHNTTISAASTPCWNSITFTDGLPQPVQHITNNIWILDNVLCKQPTGDYQMQGTAGLTAYMGDPSISPYDLTQRYYGNVMYVPTGNKVQVFPPHNYATTVPFTFVNPGALNYQLLTPFWTDTSDGNIAGVNSASLPSPY